MFRFAHLFVILQNQKLKGNIIIIIDQRPQAEGK